MVAPMQQLRWASQQFSHEILNIYKNAENCCEALHHEWRYFLFIPIFSTSSASESRFFNTSWALKTWVEWSHPPAAPAGKTQVFSPHEVLKWKISTQCSVIFYLPQQLVGVFRRLPVYSDVCRCIPTFAGVSNKPFIVGVLCETLWCMLEYSMWTLSS